MKDVCGYEGLYKVDENGNVFSVRNNKFLKRMTFPSGYEYVHLCNECWIDPDKSLHRKDGDV